MTWHDERMVAFDIETTGTDVEAARIVTAAVAFVGGGQETEAYDWLVNPGVPIPEEAAAIHGVTTERAREEGRDPFSVLDEVLEALRAGSPIVAFNARYDLTVLDRECRRHGLTPPGDLLVVDPFVLDKHLARFRRGGRKLADVCAHRGAVLEEAHEAGADAIAAARLAWRIAKSGQVERRVRGPQEREELIALRSEWKRVKDDLPALHEAQVRWAAEQSDSLREYFRGRGDEAWREVRSEWPIIPAAVVA